MRQEFIRRTDRGVMSPGAQAKLSRHRRLSFIVGRVRYIQVGACGLAREVIDQSDEIIRQDFDIVANCTGGCPIAGASESDWRRFAGSVREAHRLCFE